MSKREFIEAYAAKTGESKKRSEELVNNFLTLVEESLLKGYDVQFTGWGSFSLQEKKARTGRNPQTGSQISIPAKKVVKFKVGKNLSESIDK